MFSSLAAKLAFPFIAVVLPLAGGAFLGPRVKMRDQLGKRLVFFALVFCYPVVTFLAGWRVTITWELVWLPVAGMAISLAGLAIGWAMSKLHAWPQGAPARGAYILATGLNNMGSTGGALLCFALLGEEGFAQATVLVFHWQFLIYLVCFPLARHWSAAHQRLSIKGEIAEAFRDPRLLPLVGLALGLALNMAGVERPRMLGGMSAIGVAIAASTAAFGVGLSIRAEKFGDYKHLYSSQFVAKFALLPALCVGISHVIAMSPMARNIILIQASCPQAFYAVFLAHFFDLDHHQANSMFIVNSILYVVLILPVLVAFI
ncbi:MAG: hypothetical protein HN742_34965 [Lentisphaerae bacterium]|nr:hypothetical protein [Lentisphaerota bacterium]MBT4815425.1 hypothetical protein [Lentisphaerota bacterium]MBT5609229.1 hypothetical protein [Lentisphaerota bacterium]MBT7059892.1 hypothetical protein [Lentisphaerota bacterium]MBT7847125.1 hypothetical protein [Lentisphaerota bacterium]